MVRRLLLGILKGLLIGAAVGALVHFALGTTVLTAAWMGYLLYGLVGALAGALAGKAPWKPGAWIESLIKGFVGIGVGAGLFALAKAFLTAKLALFPGVESTFAMQPMLFAPALAALYGALVELDNDGKSDEAAAPSGVRVGGEEEAEEDEAPASGSASQSRRKNG